jgi:hypothetical protein
MTLVRCTFSLAPSIQAEVVLVRQVTPGGIVVPDEAAVFNREWGVPSCSSLRFEKRSGRRSLRINWSGECKWLSRV